MISSTDLINLGWHHIGTSANGGSKTFSNRNADDKQFPIYLIKYHGDNFSMKNTNDPKLTEIQISEVVKNENGKTREERIYIVDHYIGHPTLEQLKEEISKLQWTTPS